MAPEEAPPTEQQTKKKLAFSFENLNQAAIANTKGQVARGDGSAKKPARPAKSEPAKAEAAPKPAPKPAAQKPARKKKQQDDWAADHLAQADQAHEQLERLEPLAEERGDGNDAGTEAPPQLHGDVRPPKPRRKGLGLMGLLDGSDDD